MGDTGPQTDPQGHGQDLSSPLGKMLRIDVDHESDGRPYAIPRDNPFRSRASENVRTEIYAYGFREPWRFSFDSLTHDLWVGDVGQDRIDEIDLVRPGENFGWNVYEGFDLFSTRYRRDERAPFTPPVFAYNRRLGNSITGGYVYRGDPKSPFYGLHICGDFTSRRVWALKQSDRKLTGAWQIGTSPEPIASFAQDASGGALSRRLRRHGLPSRLHNGEAELIAACRIVWKSFPSAGNSLPSFRNAFRSGRNEFPAHPEAIPDRPEVIPVRPEVIPDRPEVIPVRPEVIPDRREVIPLRPEFIPERPRRTLEGSKPRF
jgi:hypothetical protein